MHTYSFCVVLLIGLLFVLFFGGHVLSGFRRGVLVLLFLCFSLTFVDVLFVEGYFRPGQVWDRIWMWHAVFLSLVLLAPLLVSVFVKSLVPLAVWFFFWFGLEDTLFYGFQGYLPVSYRGVFVAGVWEPSLFSVLQMNVLGLIVILAFVLNNRECLRPEFICRNKKEVKRGVFE